jgi:hypothetical protein
MKIALRLPSMLNHPRGLLLSLALLTSHLLLAAAPEQFLVWGSFGPESPPVLAGWNCLPGHFGLLGPSSLRSMSAHEGCSFSPGSI